MQYRGYLFVTHPRLVSMRYSSTVQLVQSYQITTRASENQCPSDSLLVQVFLSKQQTTDLSGKVQKLLFEKDVIERLGIDGLRVQLARTKAVRQKASASCFVFPLGSDVPLTQQATSGLFSSVPRAQRLSP